MDDAAMADGYRWHRGVQNQRTHYRHAATFDDANRFWDTGFPGVEFLVEPTATMGTR